MLTAKKVELGDVEERGVYEVMEGEAMEQTPGRHYCQQNGSSPMKEHRKPSA